MPFAFPPIDVLLTWPVPNFKNPIKRGPENYVVGGVFLALATVALAMRLYARLVIRRWFGLDDVMICVAFVGEREMYLSYKLTGGRYLR